MVSRAGSRKFSQIQVCRLLLRNIGLDRSRVGKLKMKKSKKYIERKTKGRGTTIEEAKFSNWIEFYIRGQLRGTLWGIYH